MADYQSNHLYAVLPPQKLSYNKKDKKWGENCVEAISSMGNTRYLNGRTSWGRKQANYDLVNSILNEEDYKYVMDPYGLGDNKVGAQPAKMRNINLIFNKLSLLKGEEMSRPFNFQVAAINGEALSEKEEVKKEILMEAVMARLSEQAGIPMSVSEDPNRPKQFSMMDKYINSTVKNIREHWGNDILNYLKHKEQMVLKFNEGWEHALVSAEEIYYVGIVNGEPKVRVCNPLNVEFDRNPDNPNIEDGDWFREDRWMTVGQILDEYGEYMSDDEVRKLDQGDLRQGLGNQMFPGFAYTQSDMNQYDRGSFSNRTRASSSHYLVTHVVWKSMKKIGFVDYLDENDQPQTSIVPEDFKLTPDMKAAGYQLEWRWIPEVWHGTKIAESFYVNIEPMPNVARYMDNPSEVKLPYIGRVYNCTNSVQTSLVDLLKPHQYLYNIIWFRLETELAKAKGKKMVMDIAMIPRSEGIDIDKWMYMFDNVGIAFINSFEEGKDKFQGQVSQFNQFQNIDMGLSQAVGQYINILSKIEQIMDKVCGITPQREGQVMATETKGGIEHSTQQSSAITEPWFYIHNENKRKVLTQLLETAKFAYPNKKKLHYIMDDVQRVSVEIDMEKFADSDYGVFVTNDPKQALILSKIESLVNQAIASGTASLTDAVKMFKATSIGELSDELEQSEEKKHEREMAQTQAQQQMQSEQIQAQAEEKQRDREHDDLQKQLDRENDVRVATIKSMSFDQDIQGTGANEVLEAGYLAVEQSKSANEAALKNLELSQNASEKEKDRRLKREEIASKERIEKLKAKTAMKNKTSGEK